MMTSFHLENLDPGSPNFHLKEFLYWPTYPQNVMFLALTGVEKAEGIICTRPQGRVIFRPSPGSVLIVAINFGIWGCLKK